MTSKAELPEEYPKRLRSISWCLETKGGDRICGPHKYYNRHLPYDAKGDSLFVKQVLLDYFYKHGCGPEVCDDMCQYYVKHFTVIFDEDNQTFMIIPKKDKETKKPTFSESEWQRLCGYSDRKDAMRLWKMMSQHLVKFYNGMIDNMSYAM